MFKIIKIHKLYNFLTFKVIQPKKVTLKRTSVTVLNGDDDTKPQQEEKKNEETDELDDKDRIIKLDDVESMSQTEVKCLIALFKLLISIIHLNCREFK